MKHLVILLCMLLVGCASPVPRAIPVNVAVPIKCKAAIPERGVFPTEMLKPNARDFDIARAALAELSFREAYEGKLLSELKSCL